MFDRRPVTRSVAGILLVVLIAVGGPLFLGETLLQTGTFVFAAVIAAIGLNILVGTAGQLSLAEPFFLAIGAFTYSYLAGGSDQAQGEADGLGLPPVLAFVAAIVVSGAAGWAFSPISGRVRGIYLGLATLGLIFVGQHLMLNVTPVTGGYDGRAVPPLTLGPLSFDDSGVPVYLLNHLVTGLDKIWMLGVVLAVVALWIGHGVVRSRPGRAMRMLRDSETAAATLGINVQRQKAAAFTLASAYAGCAGAYLALAFGYLVPSYFGIALGIDYMAMLVIGGLGYLSGGVIGAIFITALPTLLSTYASDLPLISNNGSPIIEPSSMARIIYGVFIVVLILLEPQGVVGAFRRFAARLGVKREAPTASPLSTESTVS